MELLDYARLRWKVLLLVFVLGLAAIGIVATGAAAAQKQYVASVDVLIRPPAAQLNVFAFDLDRYIDTEVATLYSDSSLKAEASGTNISAGELKDALTTSHDPGTDVVTFSVKTSSARDSKSIANHVASVYLSQAQARDTGSNQESIAYIQQQLSQQQQIVRSANAALARAFRQLRDSTPDISVADPLLLNPRAYSQQQVGVAAIQQLNQQLLSLQLSSQDSGLSRVLRAADSAQASVQPWRPTTVAAAVAGLILALVALTAVALSFSNRVVSIGRWRHATSETPLRPAIRGRVRRQRAHEMRRLAVGVANVGAPGPVTVIQFPSETRRSKRAVPRLMKGLESSGWDCRAGEELGAQPSSHRAEEGPIVAVVDLSSCRVEDVAVMADGDPARLRRIVPVLI